MESFSALATPVSLVVLLLAVAAFAPGKRPGMCCAVNLVLVVVINQVLKFIIQRPRPDGFRLATASGFSFPSGHSMVAMAFFGLLAWLVWKYEADRRLRRLYATGFALVIVMIGVSRIYLGVHYASDVLGRLLSVDGVAGGLHARGRAAVHWRGRPWEFWRGGPAPLASVRVAHAASCLRERRGDRLAVAPLVCGWVPLRGC